MAAILSASAAAAHGFLALPLGFHLVTFILVAAVLFAGFGASMILDETRAASSYRFNRKG
jgi:hypothetical protein